MSARAAPLVAAALLAPAVALAHGAAARAPDSSAGAIDAGMALALSLALALYGVGTARVWRRAGAGRGVRRGEALAFAAGWLALAAAILSPIDRLGGERFSAHMLQHELLILVAAPLLVRARPQKGIAWGLPGRARGSAMRALRGRTARAAWRKATGLAAAWLAHAAALWLWHVPALFEASVESDAVHAFQHLSFFASAVLWWASLGAASAPGADRHGAALFSVFTTALHGGALGALLVFSRTVWISAYEASAHARGFSALEDQQLAGLVMWIPAGVLFASVSAALVWRWLEEAARRSTRGSTPRGAAG